MNELEMNAFGQTKTIETTLTVEQARKIRDAKKFESNVKGVFISVVSSATGAGVAGVIGAGALGGAGAIASILGGYDPDEINDLVKDLDAGRISTLKSITTMRYRNAGRNSGWYVDDVRVVGVR